MDAQGGAAASERPRLADTGPHPADPWPTLLSMLSDEEAEEIRRKVAEGWRGPVLLTRRERERGTEPPES